MGAAGPQRLEPGEKVGQAHERLLGLRHRGPGKLQLLAVMHAKVQVTERRGPEPALDDVVEVVDVAEGLRHLLGALRRPLLVVDHQVFDVDPEARELAAGGPFALGDLVLVVREDQVDAAGVDVDRRLAEQPQRHRRTFDVPARTSLDRDARGRRP